MGRLRSGAGLLAGLWLCCWNVEAQDSFDNSKLPPSRPPAQTPPQPRQGAQTQPATQTQQAAPPAAGDAGEAQDFGVKPATQLRPNEQLHGPTPTSIPGGKVIGTRQLAQAMQGQQNQQGTVMLLHAIASQRHLPNAIPVAPASQGGTFDDQVQRDFGNYLEQATGGDRARLLVTYCAGVQCWGSYNAALRAIKMGYTNVHWYRGGLEAWEKAGLPVLTASNEGSPSTASVPGESARTGSPR